MLISRDPNTRTEIYRETVHTNESCSWCGQRRNSHSLYQYRIQTDGGQAHIILGLFCSISCKRIYHGEGE